MKRFSIHLISIGICLFVLTLSFGWLEQVSYRIAYAAESASATTTLDIPAIHLSTPIITSTLQNHTPTVPSYIASAYSHYPSKTLLLGHSATVFQDLPEVKLGDIIYYNNSTYFVSSKTIKPKSTISMAELLAPAKTDTIIIMTCSGMHLEDQDYADRLIITASKI